MKPKTILIIAVVLASTATANTLEMGLSSDFRSLRLKDVPPEVKQEAMNASIVNPYSGRYFGKDTIGTYNPKENFKFIEVGLFGQYTFDLDSELKPYVRGEFQYPFLASTHKGHYGHRYTYEQVLGSGSDYVRYTYGIEYRYAYWFEPEIGLKLESDDGRSISFGVSYQRLELNYYKGIEAWGSTKHLYKIGQSKHDLFNYKLRFRWDVSDSLMLDLEPTYSHGDNLEGYGIALSICKKY